MFNDAQLFTLATLSRHGLSAPEIALAIAVAVPGQSPVEVVTEVRRRIDCVRNIMSYRGLFDSIRSSNRQRRSSKQRNRIEKKRQTA